MRDFFFQSFNGGLMLVVYYVEMRRGGYRGIDIEQEEKKEEEE